ncbi:MAG: TA system antitoxin ParD family protein [Hydrogenovibrio sp.]
MSISVRINDDFYQEAKSQAKAELRSIPNQIEYWARIGKTAMENPELSIEAIKELLVAKHQEVEPFEFRDGE